MLKMMRHHAKYFYVLFFIIILTFIFWGVGTVDKTSQGTVVAEVGKIKITGEEYWRTYDRTYKFYRDLYKEKFDEEAQKKLNLKENVLNSLIESRVLLIAAKEKGIIVSDDELNEAITNEAAFMKNGIFDHEIYVNRLRLSRITPDAYEAAKREELTLTRIKRLIESSAIIPSEELSKISADEQTMKTLKEALVSNAREKAVKAYVEGLKKGMKIKIYKDLLA
ncbi:MAG: SurA N-terminal domain-containing protein [Nitrospirae bacterium]|nr:SurA N-terminal domain-containing protein [Nitrospirota bacterium]